MYQELKVQKRHFSYMYKTFNNFVFNTSPAACILLPHHSTQAKMLWQRLVYKVWSGIYLVCSNSMNTDSHLPSGSFLYSAPKLMGKLMFSSVLVREKCNTYVVSRFLIRCSYNNPQLGRTEN